MGKLVFLFLTPISMVKKGDVASTQWKEKLPPSLEEVEEKDSKEAL